MAWHPVTGGFCIAVFTAALLAGVGVFVAAAMPLLDGWAICTPRNGVVLALMLMTRRKLWPWVAIGYVVALSESERVFASIVHLSALQIAGNFAEVGLAAFTLPPFRNLKQWLQERRLIPAFLIYAMIAGPALMSFTVAHDLPAPAQEHFWPRVLTVALAEALGVALATPLLLVLFNRETYAIFHLRVLPETLALFLFVVASTWFALHAAGSSLFLLAPIILLVVIAFRLGLGAAVLGTAATVAVAITRNFHAQGLAAQTQGLFAVAVVGILPLSVTLANRRFLEDRLTDAQGELDKLKSLDRLTGVPNRKRFDLVLDREWQRATRDPKPVALLMVDVDDFDLFNQHYGSQAGDECLRLVASRMSDKPHRAYDLISRYEGGKFTVLLPGASGEAVERIAEEFRAEIAAQEWPHELSPFERVTVSVGWAAMIPSEQSAPDALIAAAGNALHLARENGKNRVEGVNFDVDAVITV